MEAYFCHRIYIKNYNNKKDNFNFFISQFSLFFLFYFAIRSLYVAILTQFMFCFLLIKRSEFSHKFITHNFDIYN